MPARKLSTKPASYDCGTVSDMRGIYGQNRYFIGAEPELPVKLQDVSAGAGLWLGFLAFFGWGVAKTIDAGVTEIIRAASGRKSNG